jgi:ABC-type hemin transport system ATPase subunit
MLELLDVAKVYTGGVRRVDGVTMRLGPGLVGLLGLLGPNGAGNATGPLPGSHKPSAPARPDHQTRERGLEAVTVCAGPACQS